MYFGNEYLQDAIYEQTVLNEMHISKSDLKDPKILDKVLEKSKKEADNKSTAVVHISLLLGVAADVVLGIATGSIALSLVAFLPFIGGALALSFKWFESLPNYEEKNIKKLVDKTEKLKKNTMRLKDSKEKKEILDRCDKILESVEKHYKDKATKAKQEKYNDAKRWITDIIKHAKGEKCDISDDLAEVYEEYYVADKIGLIKPSELDKVITDYCMKHDPDPNDGGIMEYFFGEDTVEGALKHTTEKEINDLEKIIPGFKENIKVYVFYAIDDTIFFFNRKNKTFYNGDYDAKWLKYNKSLYKLAETSKNESSKVSKEDIEMYKQIYEELKK